MLSNGGLNVLSQDLYALFNLVIGPQMWLTQFSLHFYFISEWADTTVYEQQMFYEKSLKLAGGEPKTS